MAAFNYQWPQLQRGEKTHVNDSSGEGVGQEGATRNSLLLLYSDFLQSERFVPHAGRHVAVVGFGVWPRNISFPFIWFMSSPPSDSSSKGSSSQETCIDLPNLSPYHPGHPSFKAQTTAYCFPSLFLCLSKLETPGNPDLCLSCLQADPHQFTQYPAQSRCSVFNRLTAHDMNVCVPTLYEFFVAQRCYPLPPKHLHTHCSLSSTDVSPVSEYGS